jgi:hypothetical protein
MFFMSSGLLMESRMGFTAGPEYGGPDAVSLAMERGALELGRDRRRRRELSFGLALVRDGVVIFWRVVEGVVNASAFVDRLNKRAVAAIDNFIVTFLSETTID